MTHTATGRGVVNWFRQLVRRMKDRRVMKELIRMERDGEIARCDFCGRWKLPETDCDCMEPS